MPQRTPNQPYNGLYLYSQLVRFRPTGAHVWYLGLLALVVPYVGSVVASVTMIVVGLRCRRGPEPARSNGTAAACWGINYLLTTIVLIGGFLVYEFTFMPEDAKGVLPWGLPVIIWMLISLFHVIICIAFGVRASRGKVVPFRGIPFIK